MIFPLCKKILKNIYVFTETFVSNASKINFIYLVLIQLFIIMEQIQPSELVKIP